MFPKLFCERGSLEFENVFNRSKIYTLIFGPTSHRNTSTMPPMSPLASTHSKQTSIALRLPNNHLNRSNGIQAERQPLNGRPSDHDQQYPIVSAAVREASTQKVHTKSRFHPLSSPLSQNHHRSLEHVTQMLIQVPKPTQPYLLRWRPLHLQKLLQFSRRQKVCCIQTDFEYQCIIAEIPDGKTTTGPLVRVLIPCTPMSSSENLRRSGNATSRLADIMSWETSVAQKRSRYFRAQKNATSTPNLSKLSPTAHKSSQYQRTHGAKQRRKPAMGSIPRST